MSIYATIDIGSNSLLLLVAEKVGDGNFRPISERMEITRLGKGVDKTKRISSESLELTRSVISAFADEARSLGAREIVATATSAARDAENGQELVKLVRACGVDIEIVSGAREAQLSFQAVANDFSVNGKSLGMIDIGGGSTEIVVGTGNQISFRHSFDVGAVRMTERFLRTDPPAQEDLDSLRRYLSSEFSQAEFRSAPDRLVGIAGTFTTLAAISLKMESYDPSRVHGHLLSRVDLASVLTRLESLSLSEREKVVGLSPKRADVIVAGGYIALAAMNALAKEEILIGDKGIRWGYLYEKFA